MHQSQWRVTPVGLLQGREEGVLQTRGGLSCCEEDVRKELAKPQEAETTGGPDHASNRATCPPNPDEFGNHLGRHRPFQFNEARRQSQFAQTLFKLARPVLAMVRLVRMVLEGQIIGTEPIVVGVGYRAQQDPTGGQYASKTQPLLLVGSEVLKHIPGNHRVKGVCREGKTGLEVMSQNPDSRNRLGSDVHRRDFPPPVRQPPGVKAGSTAKIEDLPRPRRQVPLHPCHFLGGDGRSGQVVGHSL